MLIVLIPKLSANSHFFSSISKPITLHPTAFNICAVIKPTRPKPITTIDSPIVGLHNLTPCKKLHQLR